MGTQRLNKFGLHGLDLVGHIAHLQFSDQIFSIAISKLQICPILYFLGIPPKLVDCIYHLLWHMVLSPLPPFKDSLSF